jgi:chemotaxis protein methyltransferase WspC
MTGTESNELRRVEAVLRRRIGLNAETVGPRLIPLAVETRMAACHIDSVAAYVTRLHMDEEELAELTEEVVVPESWFFREVSPFRCLREFAQTWRSRNGTSRRFRVLSVPCSRGEEPYSVAMTLMDLAWRPDQFEILAVDLSRRALQLAQQGVYRPSALREQEAGVQRLQRLYFRQRANEFELAEDVRGTVRFMQGNVVAWDFLHEERPFDVILCRNLLIYLGPESRQIVMRHVRRLLAPGGLFYVGHTECRLASGCGFVGLGSDYPAAFTVEAAPSSPPPGRTAPAASGPGREPGTARLAGPLAKASPPASAAEAARPSAPANGVSSAQTQRPTSLPPTAKPLRGDESGLRSGRPEGGSGREGVAVASPGATRTALSLAACRQAADAGRLTDAVAMCERVLSETGPSGDAYCLLGVIREAQGDLGAAEACFQRALYLAPDHHESLVHMSLLCLRRGDHLAAANFTRRAQRSTSSGNVP